MQLSEKPLANLVVNKKLDMPFYGPLSIGWANLYTYNLKIIVWVHGPMIKRILMRVGLFHLEEKGIWIMFVMDRQFHPLGLGSKKRSIEVYFDPIQHLCYCFCLLRRV